MVLAELKKEYKNLLDILDEYGGVSVRPQINQIKDILDLLESFSSNNVDDTVLDELRKMNDVLYPPRDGLSEFYIWSDDFDERMKLNKPLDRAKKIIWKLLNS